MKAQYDGKGKLTRPTNYALSNSSITVAWVTFSKYVLQLSNSIQTKVWMLAACRVWLGSRWAVLTEVMMKGGWRGRSTKMEDPAHHLSMFTSHLCSSAPSETRQEFACWQDRLSGMKRWVECCFLGRLYYNFNLKYGSKVRHFWLCKIYFF